MWVMQWRHLISALLVATTTSTTSHTTTGTTSTTVGTPENDSFLNFTEIDPGEAMSTVAVLDLAAADPALNCFTGGFTDGTYGYVIPFYNGAAQSGNAARFDLASFATTAALDLAAADPALKGFVGGFTDGTYGYAMPRFAGAAYSGKVGRFDLAGFTTTEALDLAAADPALKGFAGGFTDGTYGYAIPFSNGVAYSGKVARFDLAGFATTAALDLAAVDPALKGFWGGFTDGTYGYLIPYYNGAAYSGKVARFDLVGFATTTALDLVVVSPAFTGFAGGFTDGTYGYAVPYHHTAAAHFGKMARFDLADFATISILDFAAADPALTSFVGGFIDGTYGYAIPFHENAAVNAGKVARFDLAGFATISALDLAATDPALKGFWGGFTDGTYGYAIPYYNGAHFGKVARFEVSQGWPDSGCGARSVAVPGVVGMVEAAAWHHGGVQTMDCPASYTGSVVVQCDGGTFTSSDMCELITNGTTTTPHPSPGTRDDSTSDSVPMVPLIAGVCGMLCVPLICLVLCGMRCGSARTHAVADEPEGGQPDQEALRCAGIGVAPPGEGLGARILAGIGLVPPGEDLEEKVMAVISPDIRKALEGEMLIDTPISSTPRGTQIEDQAKQQEVSAQQSANARQGVVPGAQEEELESAIARAAFWNERVPEEVLAAMPSYWNCRDATCRDANRVNVEQAEQDLLQKLLDDTFQEPMTRDRKGERMPAGLKIVQASRVENAALWKNYARRRWDLGSRMRPGGYTALSESHGSEVMTARNEMCKKGELDGKLNEVYLWHGTSLHGALVITSEGFDLALAGSNAGTMYGDGVYLAECCSKADEVAEDEKEGPDKGVFCLLLCRVVLGEVLKVTTGGSGTHAMIRAALDTRAYHSILGDRAAVKSTYREFVVYKEAQVYPEYMVRYRRMFEEQD